MADSPSTAQKMSALINQGKARQALDMAAQYRTVQTIEADKADANFWFAQALAASQIPGIPRKKQFIAQCRKNAEMAPNFTEAMAGDFERDAALVALRERNLPEASKHNALAIRIHRFDKNRYAADLSVAARIRSAEHDNWNAIVTFDKAEAIWAELALTDQEAVNETFRFNARFHRLFAWAERSGSQAKQRRLQDFRYLLWRSLPPERLQAIRDGREPRSVLYAIRHANNPPKLLAARLAQKWGVGGVVASHWLTSAIQLKQRLA